MPSEVGSRKRIPLSKHKTYEEADAAKNNEVRYSPSQLQIRHKHDGYVLVARVNLNTSKENTSNG